MERTSVEGPLGIEDEEEMESMIQDDPASAYLSNQFCVTEEKLVVAIDKMGEFVQNKMDALKAYSVGRYNVVIATVAHFALTLITGFERVVLERNQQNTATNEMPPVL